MKLDEQQLRAVCALRGNPEFQVFMDALGAEAEKLTQKLIMDGRLDSGQLYQLRGQAKATVSIIEAIVEAPAQLDSITTHREK